MYEPSYMKFDPVCHQISKVYMYENVTSGPSQRRQALDIWKYKGTQKCLQRQRSKKYYRPGNRHCTLRKKSWNEVCFVHTLRFLCFVHRIEVGNVPHIQCSSFLPRFGVHFWTRPAGTLHFGLGTPTLCMFCCACHSRYILYLVSLFFCQSVDYKAS